MSQSHQHKTVSSAGNPLLSTGIPGFDAILGGGFPVHHLYLIQGLAGSGKTTLACQIGFNHARQGRKVLILTLIAESHAKLLQHLANFSFFDMSLLDRQVKFFGGYAALAQGGLRELLNFISACLNEHQPEIMIVDGFRSVRDYGPTDLALSEFMHSLNALAAAMGCTTFLLSPIEGNIAESENTLVDGLVELSQYEDGVRTVREIRVYKLRGGNHFLGKHAFEVGGNGIVVYPRLEAIATRTNIASPASDRLVSFGIPSWDRLTGGGIMHGSITSLVGSPGVGKTIMGLHFIEQGLRDNETCLILGFFESPPRLLQKGRKVGMDLSTAMQDGRLEMMWHLPLEVLMDRLATDLLDNIDRRKVTRLLIDGIEGFHDIAVHTQRIKPFLIALVNELRARNVTTFITQELPYFKESFARADSTESVLYENVMLLRTVEIDGANRRLISVMKLRESGYDPAHHVMTISDKGIVVEQPVSEMKAATARTNGL
ncbi:MAG TPA: ATPase domain-containing protein [Noviherbaspirillum sp.]|uniref:ATPase domain-containing protein n=1 Tax=Noviherbaspirillum sp. TaxID=1926288 RepID=UPI002D398EDE|nr:ATPase domain-containing protein [Noviherbaspirillum sp.]HYD94124.1 ATPase domain-containing protein [Noviherbaspirillum sp.]